MYDLLATLHQSMNYDGGDMSDRIEELIIEINKYFIETLTCELLEM